MKMWRCSRERWNDDDLDASRTNAAQIQCQSNERVMIVTYYVRFHQLIRRISQFHYCNNILIRVAYGILLHLKPLTWLSETLAVMNEGELNPTSARMPLIRMYISLARNESHLDEVYFTCLQLKTIFLSWSREGLMITLLLHLNCTSRWNETTIEIQIEGLITMAMFELFLCLFETKTLFKSRFNAIFTNQCHIFESMIIPTSSMVKMSLRFNLKNCYMRYFLVDWKFERKLENSAIANSCRGFRCVILWAIGPAIAIGCCSGQWYEMLTTLTDCFVVSPRIGCEENASSHLGMFNADSHFVNVSREIGLGRLAWSVSSVQLPKSH